MYNHSFDYASVGVRLTQGILDKTKRLNVIRNSNTMAAVSVA